MASWLFQQLVAVSGLSPIFARTTLKRACERGGISPYQLTRSDLVKALPSIRLALETYLAPDVVEDRLREIRRLAGGGSAHPSGELRAHQDAGRG